MNDRINWMEVIKLRTIGNRFNSLKDEILQTMYEPDAPHDMTRLVLLRHATWETDWSIHLHWETTQVYPHASPPGQRLISTLGEFGRVNHALWLQDMILTGSSLRQSTSP